MQIVLIIVSLFIYCVVNAQYNGPNFPIDDKWFNEYGKKALQVGDKMPDISLGKVLNNKTGKKRFSDFKGKLVILDFWDTYCSSCIAGFPKMEQLQKEFGNQIQIILVNVRENESDILARTKDKKGFKMPDLPCIVSDFPFASREDKSLPTHQLARLFPTVGVPYHVWIDGQGVIRLVGGSENTYASKIRDILSNKPITFLKNYSAIPDLKNDKNARYFQQLGYLRKTPLSWGSFLTPFNNEVTGAYGMYLHEKVDSFAGTRITGCMNQDLLDLYLACFFKQQSILGRNSKLLFSPSVRSVMDFIQFPAGMDTLLYTSNPSIVERHLTTEEIIRSKYCYEQVVPLTVSEEDRYRMMLEDLNRYFKVHYGIIGSVQNKLVKHYELIRISDKDKIGDISSTRVSKVVKEGNELRFQFQNDLNDLFASMLRNGNTPPPGFLYDDGQPLLIFNGTGWASNKKVALNISLKSLQSLSGLRSMLQGYDLDVVERHVELPFYVFSRVNQIN